jgi:hypothetical protein
MTTKPATLPWNLVAKNLPGHELLQKKIRVKITKLEKHLVHLPDGTVTCTSRSSAIERKSITPPGSYCVKPFVTQPVLNSWLRPLERANHGKVALLIENSSRDSYFDIV